jgi:hypothetical protein
MHSRYEMVSFAIGKWKKKNILFYKCRKNVVETEGTIKNGQSRDIGNNGKTRHSTKTNKHKNTTHEIKKMSNKKTWLNPGARGG